MVLADGERVVQSGVLQKRGRHERRLLVVSVPEQLRSNVARSARWSNSANFKDPTTGYAVTGSLTYDGLQDYLTDVGAYPSAKSRYGSFDMGGDVLQVTETVPFMRGGSWSSDSNTLRASSHGFFNSQLGIQTTKVSASPNSPNPEASRCSSWALLDYWPRRGEDHARVGRRFPSDSRNSPESANEPAILCSVSPPSVRRFFSCSRHRRLGR